MKKPDFFIVGAPKSGTTALHRYLRQHPEIFMSNSKEPHFFGSDLPFTGPRISLGEYLSCFSEAGKEKRAGEGSVWYLYSKRAAAEIRDFCSPQTPSIIIILRNPVDMIYSLHAQRVYNANEDILDFKAALKAEKDRNRNLCIPKRAGNVMLSGFRYRETAKYTEQVRRYLDAFGRQNVHIIIFDDFRKGTAQVYKETCEFLGVDTRFRPKFSIVNANKRARIRTLQCFLRKSSPINGWIEKKSIVAHRGLQLLRRANTVYAPRAPMDHELRMNLQNEFRPEVEKLSEMLGRDLTFWCRA